MASLLRLRPAIARTLRPYSTRSLQHVSPYINRYPSNSFSTAQTEAQSTVSVGIPSDATTAGTILQYLNVECKDTLDNAHIQALAKSIESPSDYPKLLHAITTFKRTRGYVMDSDTAAVVIDSVLKANEDSSVEGPLWVLENFKPRTGLYFSATVYKLDDALEQLLQVCREKDEIDTERVWKALQNLSTRLMERKALRGARGLKKRAKKEYLRCLQNKGGPTNETVRRVAEIGVSVKGVEETKSTFIDAFQAANVSIHPRTLGWLEDQANVGEEDNEGDGNDGEKESEEDSPASEADTEDQQEGKDEEKKE